MIAKYCTCGEASTDKCFETVLLQAFLLSDLAFCTAVKGMSSCSYNITGANYDASDTCAYILYIQMTRQDEIVR